MISPTKTVFDPRRKTTRAWYEKDPQQELFMRGGVCWPYAEYMGNRIRLQGYAVLCAQNVKTDVVTVVMHTEFKTIEPMIHPETQMVIHPGLAQWFNECWSKWYCRKFYWHDMSVTSRNYRIAVGRSQICQPKPQFAEAKWQDDDVAKALIPTLGLEGKFKADKDLAEEIGKPASMAMKLHPPTHALICALVGLQMTPWVEPRMRREDVLRI